MGKRDKTEDVVAGRGGMPDASPAHKVRRRSATGASAASLVSHSAPAVRPTRTRDEVLEQLRAQGVRFLRLQFIDVLGSLKNVEVPTSQFEKALDGDIMFDGSSIEGFVRV